MTGDPVLDALRSAIGASPEVPDLRIRLIEVLIDRGDVAGAVSECAAALTVLPADARFVDLLTRATSGTAGPTVAAAPPSGGFDWASAEADLGVPTPPPFVDYRPTPDAPPTASDSAAAHDPAAEVVDDIDIELPTVRMADVAGMDDVKKRLDLALFAPLRNPEVARAYGMSTRGGLLLYGPPGCGKTFLGRAIAGELGARFIQVGISDVMSRWLGDSERALHAVFETARRNAPVVLFFDELDALGHKRSGMSGDSGLRPLVNQLLVDTDGAGASNSGVFVLGATNHPWDVDPALRRPGRFDATVLVTLPDPPARAAIARHHLQGRPVAGVDLGRIASETVGFSGADIAGVCTLATQRALADSVASGTVRPVTQADVDGAIATTRPSTGSWFTAARNVVDYANTDGTYDDLARYLKQRRR
ncbi:ATP-binding protein [Tsukamurella soli]|uniref:ATP-binding protein n=1 Tax=Tsukamurella soli TaxID=644556 RepID=A0ABP8JBF2_9ACTN